MERSLKRAFQQSPLALKLVASFILPSLLAVAVVTIVLSSLYSSRAREDLERVNTLHLQGIRSQMEAVISSSQKLAYLLKGDQALLDSLGTSPEAVLAYSRATTQINQFLLSTPYVDSIILGHQNRIIYSLYQRDSFRETKEKMLSLLRGTESPAPRVRLVLRPSGDVGRVLTFVSLDSNRADSIDSAAAVNVNIDQLFQDLFGAEASGSLGGRSYAIFDASGAALLDSRWIDDSGAVLSPADKARVIASVEPAGSFRTAQGPRNLMVSFVRSEVQGFSVATVVDYGTYMSGIDGLTVQTMLFCAVVVILLLGGALFLGYRLYLPLDGLFRRIQRLGRTPEPVGTIHDFAYASQVLNWTAERLDVDESLGPRILSGDPDALAKGGLVPQPGDRMVVLVGRIDGPGTGAESLVPMAALARETLADRWPCCAFSFQDRDVVVVCQIPEGFPLRPGSLEIAVRSWIHGVDHRLGLSMSVGVGDLVTVQELRSSHLQAARRVRYRTFLGGQSLVTSDPPASPVSLVPPSAEALEAATAAGDRTKAVDAVQALLRTVQQADIETRFESVLDAAERLCRVETRLGTLRQPPDRGSVLRDLENCWGVERVEAWLLGLYDRAQRSLEQVRNLRAPDLVVQAFSYLEEHYSDPLLSAALLADRLGISPQYFSRIFNEHTGGSFPDHLKHLRLEKARGLIVSRPELSLDAVCEATGFRNKTYFTTAFRQRFGVPPGRLRRAQALGAGVTPPNSPR